MTVMSEGLLLNSKYIKMGREEGGFQALLTQLSLVIVYHELIIWRLTIYLFTLLLIFIKIILLTQLSLVIFYHLAVNHLRFCDGLKCRCSMSCQAQSVIKLLKSKATSP